MPTLTGRLANFVSTRLPGLGRLGTERHVRRFRASGGKKAAKMRGQPVFLLDVVGRKSGVSRPVMLMLVRRGDDVLVCGSNGGNPIPPNWYLNLVAAGTAHVEVDGERWPVTVRDLDDGPERDECWKLLCEGYADFASYQELTDRKLPVVVLERATD